MVADRMSLDGDETGDEAEEASDEAQESVSLRGIAYELYVEAGYDDERLRALLRERDVSDPQFGAAYDALGKRLAENELVTWARKQGRREAQRQWRQERITPRVTPAASVGPASVGPALVSAVRAGVAAMRPLPPTPHVSPQRGPHLGGALAVGWERYRSYNLPDHTPLIEATARRLRDNAADLARNTNGDMKMIRFYTLLADAAGRDEDVPFTTVLTPGYVASLEQTAEKQAAEWMERITKAR